MVRDISGAGTPQSGASNTNKSANSRDVLAKQVPADQPQTAQKPESAKDVVEISSQAKVMKNLEAKLSQLPDIDQKRVDAIKSAIADGSYEVDAQRIADRMLQADDDFDFS